MTRFLAILCWTLLASSPSGACDLKLLLAQDVSGSIDAGDYALQRDGTAAAFRDPIVQQAIAAVPGGIAVALTQWAGPEQQAVSIPWWRVRHAGDAETLAERIEAMAAPFELGATSIGDALSHARDLLAVAPPCFRAVIDISGDGATNLGQPPRYVARRLAGEGVTINALVILTDPGGHTRRSALDHYAQQVVRGPGAFLVSVEDYGGYASTFRRKLLRELVPMLGAL